MRVPAGQLVADTFKAFGCEPVIINSDSIYAALKDGRADAQENPLTLADQFKLYEVVKYVAMTDHMWSGFNLLANQAAWQRLPEDIKGIIDRNVAKHVRLQRQDQIAANTRLRTELAARGLEFNTPDPAPFKKQLAGVYATWKEKLGIALLDLLSVEARHRLLDVRGLVRLDDRARSSPHSHRRGPTPGSLTVLLATKWCHTNSTKTAPTVAPINPAP